jgi:hypothetical protein
MCKKILLILLFVLWALPALADIIVDTAWVRRYSRPEYSDDWVVAIIVDELNNAYVTGESYFEGNCDYVTIKYYPNGDTAWVRIYDGPGAGYDAPVAITLDNSSSVYVFGTSQGNSIFYDYATVKYYSNGDTAWVRRYNGPGNGDDFAYAICVDNSNDIVVTGKSVGLGTNNDYATIKYYPNGDTAWVRRYNGPTNQEDIACAIAIDDSDNIYVTGGSCQSYLTYFDYVTIKYDPYGGITWIRSYDCPAYPGYDIANAVTVDASKNIYVTGTSEGNAQPPDYDYATIKYDSSGNQLWISRYNGPGNGWDEATAIAVDNFGDVYVTGSSPQSSGLPPSANMDYATIKYYSNGDTAWIRRYNGSGNDWDQPADITIDGFENVYVTGSTVESGMSYDWTTIKYYPNGDTCWIRRYDGPANSLDFARSIALRNSHYVYVAGGSREITGHDDFTTIKYVQYLRGDVTGDWLIDLNDVVYLIKYLYANGDAPDLQDSGNTNCDELINLEDVVYLINYVLKAGPEPSC